MTEAQFNEIAAWQSATFGKATPYSKIAHLAEELSELIESIAAGHSDTRLEFADCFFLLFGAAASHGMSYADIINCIDEKFAINKARKWGQPDGNGVVRHEKGGDE